MNAKNDGKKPLLGNGVYHPGARPMQVIIDKRGNWWLCDKGLIRLDKNLWAQGCWRCQDMAFTRND
jgi:streptogramin lyase